MCPGFGRPAGKFSRETGIRPSAADDAAKWFSRPEPRMLSPVTGSLVSGKYKPSPPEPQVRDPAADIHHW